MHRELKWFEDREMDIVMMFTPDNKEVPAEINNKIEASYYYNLQKKGFTFEPKIRVHRAAPAVCESCEG